MMKNHGIRIAPALAIATAFFFQALPGNAQTTVSGTVGISAGAMNYSQTDDSEAGNISGFAIDGNANVEFGGWEFMLDINGVRHRDSRGTAHHYAPWGVASYGLHAGRTIGNAYVGGFIGGNAFQGRRASTPDGFVTGTLWGVEGKFEPASMSGVTFFGQLGRAIMVGDPGDVAFIGTFARLGTDVAVGNDFGLMVSAEFGRSPNIFEDSGDWGEYRLVTIEGRYQPSNIIYSVGGEIGQFIANTEDSAVSNRLFAKVTIPFGPKPKRNLLKTPYGPGLAAAWAYVLD